MAGQIGAIGEFEEGREEWTQYAERLGHFLVANGITEDERKRAVLLSVIGPKAYKLLGSLVAPKKPGEKSYAELVKVMTDHYNPLPSEIVQRFKFHTRVRREGESMAAYVAGLRALGQTCGFGDMLDDMLRDRLVCGVNDRRIQHRLLTETETKLTFKRALELAQSMETADKNSRELQSHASAPVSEGEVRKVNSAGVTLRCYRCGKAGHKPAHCPCKSARCYNCGKTGHLRAVCRADKKATERNFSKNRDGQVRTVLEGFKDSNEHSSVLSQIIASVNKPIILEVVLDGRPLQMELDTGAAVSLVSEATYKQLFADTPLSETSTTLKTYSGEPLRVVGQREVEVCAEKQTARLPLVVVAGDGPSLFGRDWLKSIRLDWQAIKQVRYRGLPDILSAYENVFQPGLGTLEGYEAKIFVDPEAQPHFCKARSVPYAMRAKVEEELKRLQEEDVIEPVQFADWAAPIVPVLKSDGKTVRIYEAILS